MKIRVFDNETKEIKYYEKARIIKGFRGEDVIVVNDLSKPFYLDIDQATFYTEYKNTSEIFTGDFLLNPAEYVDKAFVCRINDQFGYIHDGDFYVLTPQFAKGSMTYGNVYDSEENMEEYQKALNEVIDKYSNDISIFISAASFNFKEAPSAFSYFVENENGVPFENTMALLNQNQTEAQLLALIDALNQIEHNRMDRYNIYIANNFIVDILQKGMIYSWSRSEWLTKSKTEVMYKELWQQIRELIIERNITFHKLEWNTKQNYQASQKAKKALNSITM